MSTYINKHERWRRKQHKILWKSFGKRKIRRRFKNIKMDYHSNFYKRIRFYDYLD